MTDQVEIHLKSQEIKFNTQEDFWLKLESLN